MGEALTELKLESVVTMPTCVVYIIHTTSNEWIQHEEVDWIYAWCVSSWQNSRAWAEGAAKHSAHVVLVCCQRVCQRSSFAILQVCDERRIRVTGSCGDGGKRSAWTKGGVENRKCDLSWSPLVREAR